jgi:hypothetical protein
MIVQTENVFGAIAYSILKSEKDPIYANADPALKTKLQALAPFFLSYIGGGALARHDVVKVAAALQKHSPDLLTDKNLAEAVASAFLDAAVTITDNVY